MGGGGSALTRMLKSGTVTKQGYGAAARWAMPVDDLGRTKN